MEEDDDKKESKGISFSLYMTHGGTNWGHWAGANSPGFAPDVTSYDYDAPISESGQTTPKYWALRKTLGKYMNGEKQTKVPDMIKSVSIPAFQFTEVAPLFANLPISKKDKNIRTMEEYDQGFGTSLDRTILPEITSSAQLTVNEAHDYAQIFVNGKYIGKLDRRNGEKQLTLPACPKGTQLDILVEAMGRINFGRAIKDYKGITENVELSINIDGYPFICDLKNWEVFNIEDSYEFYKKMTDENAFPKSSLPSIQDYVDALMPSVEAGIPIICCCITTFFSGSYNSACSAKDMILEDHPDAKITVINSLQNSASMSLFVYEAMCMRDAGYSYEETVKKLEALRPYGRIIFTTESLDYLTKGGRLVRTAAMITSKLSLRPIIIMKGGEISVGGFFRTRKKAKAKVIEFLCKHFEEPGIDINDYDITVGYCTNNDEAEEFRKEVEEAIKTKLLESGVEFKTRIGVVTACHTGPTAIGEALLPKFDHI